MIPGKLIILFCLFGSHFLNAQWHWARNVASTGNLLSTGAMSSDDHIYIYSRPTLYHLDSNGILLDNYSFPSQVLISDFKINSADQLILSGALLQTFTWQGNLLTVKGDKDILVAAMDRNHNLLWVKTYGGTSEDIANAVVVDSKDNVFICGSYDDTITFFNQKLISKGYSRSFVAGFTKQGNLFKVVTDSMQTDSMYESSLAASANKLFINKNDELLVNGDVGKMRHFAFAAATMTVADPDCLCTGWNGFAVKMNSNLQPLLSFSVHQPKWYYTVEGLTSNNIFQIKHFFNYHYVTDNFILMNNQASVAATYFPFALPAGVNHESSDLCFAGVVKDDGYTVASLQYTLNQTEFYRNQLCRVRVSGFDNIADFDGRITQVNYLKGKSSSSYITGIHYGDLKAGSHQLSGGRHIFAAKLSLDDKLVGVKKHQVQDQIKVYPVPASERILLELPFTETVQVNLNDQWGKTVFSKQLAADHNVYDLSIKEQARGIYFLSIVSSGGKTVRKIVKE